MKAIALIVVTIFIMKSSAARTKRAAYDFADGVDDVVGQVRTTFQCPQRYGYFADVDNDCKVFHICNPIQTHDGQIKEVQHFSFFCGNQTIFNQLTLTCAHPEEAIPCQNAPDFFYVNDNIGQEDAPFLTDADVERAAPLIPGYGSRNNYAAASTKYEVRQHPDYHESSVEDYDVPQYSQNTFGQRTSYRKKK